MDKQRRTRSASRRPSRTGFAHALGPEVDAAELGGLLRALREALEVKQSDLAERSGLLYQNLSRLEHGRREASVSTMNRYLQALGFELVLVARRRVEAP